MRIREGQKSELSHREAMDFDPKTSILHSQREVDDYWVRYDVRLLSNIQVEWYPIQTDYMVVPLHEVLTFIPRSWLWG